MIHGLFDDYEYGDDEDCGKYDYKEVIYDYEYEDVEVPEIKVEYEEYECLNNDREYIYEENSIVIKKLTPYQMPTQTSLATQLKEAWPLQIW